MTKLELCADIYSKENIEYVIRIYGDYARINLISKDDKYILEFRKCRYDEKTTVREFENYLIGMENIRNGIS